MEPKPDSALVIVGHGSTLNPDSSRPTQEHAEAIRGRGLFREVVTAFWKEEPAIRDALRTVESDDVYVVPNFISEGYFTRTVIPRELDLDGPFTVRGRRTIKYCDPVGNHPRMTEVLLRRAEETLGAVPESETSVLIVGHGTALNENSAFAARNQAERIAALRRFGEIGPAYMEESPLVAEWDQLTRFPNVLVLPLFIADGLHSYQDIPVLLGIEEEGAPAASQREVFRRNPYATRGRQLFYASAIGTEPLMADVILDQVAAFDLRRAG